MATRTPPVTAGPVDVSRVPIYAFEKNEGTAANTFMCSLIYRVKTRLTLRNGEGVIDAVKYNRRFWPIYAAETFAEKSPQWVRQGDLLYGPDNEPLTLPLKHAYLFDCDQPHGVYSW